MKLGKIILCLSFVLFLSCSKNDKGPSIIGLWGLSSYEEFYVNKNTPASHATDVKTWEIQEGGKMYVNVSAEYNYTLEGDQLNTTFVKTGNKTIWTIEELTNERLVVVRNLQKDTEWWSKLRYTFRRMQ